MRIGYLLVERGRGYWVGKAYFFKLDDGFVTVGGRSYLNICFLQQGTIKIKMFKNMFLHIWHENPTFPRNFVAHVYMGQPDISRI